MTREEAIKVLRTESIELGGAAPSVCRFLEALDMAVNALEDVPDKDVGNNELMTLDELREAAQTGDPVWLVINRIGGWVVIEKVCYESDYPYVDYAEFGSDEPFYFEISDYGDTFMAYRQKPEDGTV